MTKLIGLGYKARQGKTTAASAMRECCPEGTKVFAFADELKRYCAAHHLELLSSYPTERPSRPSKDDPIYGHLDILQWFGTDVMRKKDPDYWIKKLEERVAESGVKYAIVDDVRYPNEAAFIKSGGGTVILVERMHSWSHPDTKLAGQQFIDPNRDPKHESEIALDGYDGWGARIQLADGHVDALREQARRLFWAITGERPL